MTRLALALAAGLVLAACGEGEREADLDTARAGAGAGLSQASRATCDQWLSAGRGERDAIMEDLEQTFGRRGTEGGVGETLPRGEALGILDRACEQPYARNFRLWKLYERAVGFN